MYVDHLEYNRIFIWFSVEYWQRICCVAFLIQFTDLILICKVFCCDAMRADGSHAVKRLRFPLIY
jgi:hypothetical protein